MPNASHLRFLSRRLLALATCNWLSRGCPAVVAASVLTMFPLPDESAFTLAPLLLTAPISFLGAVLPFGPGTEGGGAVRAPAIGFWGVWLLLCAFVNAAVLGALATRPAAAAREPPSHAPTPSAPEATNTTRSTGPRRQRARTLPAPAVDNWLARGHLAVVAASVGFFLCAAYVLPDAGFAGIWPLMATAPLSILAFPVSTPGTALSGLFNAVLLGRLPPWAHQVRLPRS
ncbi:SCO4225 family membrane protein [Streptomyces xylophagus]|uniref:SCO4225 family membrane protein n=1 Tax=Streptomyces xylophagus TaxID=285514 RepID=UPI0005B94566|nr:hypothetical protein [Streptomyces xylophagus]